MRGIEADAVDVGDKGEQRREFLAALDDAELGCLLDRVDGVAAGIGEPDHLGLRGLRLQQERGEIRGAERMADAAQDLAAALLHDVRSVLFQILPERIIRGQEKPAIEALPDGGKTGDIGLRKGVEHIMHRKGTAGLVGEADRAGSVEHVDLSARLRDLERGKRGCGSRDVEQHFDVLVVEHVARDVGGKIGLVEMVGRDHLDPAAEHLAAKILYRHLGGRLAAGAGDVGIKARHIEDAAEF